MIPRRARRVLITAVLVSIFAAAPAAAVEDFLVPGVDLTALAFEEGAWCRYVVTDEALGQVDSTEVYIGVPAAVETESGRAYWVEIESSPRGAGAEEREIMKLLVLEAISGFANGDSLSHYVLELYIKSGGRPAEAEDPMELTDVSLTSSAGDSSWVTSDTLAVVTAGGKFRCVKKERSLASRREIPTGNIKLIKTARDAYAVWFSTEIPVLHLVKCEIERMRETDTVPRISGIPAGGRKESRTTAEIIAYGHDARTLLPIARRRQ
ncbi:MAG: hypothetical protein ACE5EO_07755 [Candidatus Krumholzibacteriia bacterium]